MTISTDTATSPGKYSVSINLQRNTEYQFEVSPRGESYGPLAAFGLLGLAVDASVNENSGLFKIRGIGSKTYETTPATSLVPQEPIISTKTPPAPAKTVTSSAKERLRELKKLLDDGLIKQKDYDRKKYEILKSL